MKTQTQNQVEDSQGRFALRKPAGWGLVATLILTAAAVLCWRQRGGDDTSGSARGTGAEFVPVTPEVGRRAVSPPLLDRRAPVVTVAPLDSALADLVRRLHSDQEPTSARRRAAKALARDGSRAAFEVLKTLAEKGAPQVQEMVGEALGECPHPDAGALLERLLLNDHEAVVRSAMRGLALRGTPEAAALLGELLYDDQQPLTVRTEAALGLGAVARPEALATLARATADIMDEALASAVIRSLAGRPVEETKGFLEAYLEAPHVPAELKAEALEGLSQAAGETAPLLLRSLGSAVSEVRAAAAWSLSALESPGQAGAEILSALEGETVPLVRKRLYEALANQQAFDLEKAWAMTMNERDVPARIAGLNLLARAVQQNPSAEMTAFFDKNALPELTRTALAGGSKDERLGSVMVLRRVGTPGAEEALRQIATQATDTRVAAATGLKPR